MIWGRRGGVIVAGCALLAGCVPPSQADYEQPTPAIQPPQVVNNEPQSQPPKPPPRAPSAPQTQQKFTIAADLLFAHGGLDLTPKGQAVLNDIVAGLQTPKNSWVAVYGYTDDEQVNPGLRGNGINTNLDFSTRRAEAVEAYLLRRGLNPNNLSFKGRGEAEPVAANNTAAGRAQNRRIEIIVEGVSG